MPRRTDRVAPVARNIALYRWFRFFNSLIFWQAVWFLYFQSTLSAAQAILLYAVYDVATTALEVPSGYMSDRLGRRFTLLASAAAATAGAALLGVGGGFAIFVLGQVLIGAGMAFSSGTDSAMLYESLEAEGRAGEIEAQELAAWQISFAALALSAVAGGVLAWFDAAAPFWATALAGLCALLIAIGFREPPQAISAAAPPSQLATLKAALRQPVLAWFFALSVAMYGFSHLPFVFGQPFILESLARIGWAGEAPAVSGAVSGLMMLISVLASLMALRLRQTLGLPALLLLAFALQIALSGVLALTNSVAAIAVLLVRMVPDALSRPFITARIQPLLTNGNRATYLSLQSFCGRLVFAGALYLASHAASGPGEMAHGEIQAVLGRAVLVGGVLLATLTIAARRVPLDPS